MRGGRARVGRSGMSKRRIRAWRAADTHCPPASTGIARWRLHVGDGAWRCASRRARSGDRTRIPARVRDFKSLASTSFAIRAWEMAGSRPRRIVARADARPGRVVGSYAADVHAASPIFRASLPPGSGQGRSGFPLARNDGQGGVSGRWRIARYCGTEDQGHRCAGRKPRVHRCGARMPPVRAQKSPLARAGRTGWTGSVLRWRPGSESNRRTRICSPLHDHSATRPLLR